MARLWVLSIRKYRKHRRPFFGLKITATVLAFTNTCSRARAYSLERSGGLQCPFATTIATTMLSNDPRHVLYEAAHFIIEREKQNLYWKLTKKWPGDFLRSESCAQKGVSPCAGMALHVRPLACNS